MNLKLIQTVLKDKGIKPDYINENKIIVGDVSLVNKNNKSKLQVPQIKFLKLEGEFDPEAISNIILKAKNLTNNIEEVKKLNPKHQYAFALYLVKQNDRLLSRIGKTIHELKPKTNIYYETNCSLTVRTKQQKIEFMEILGDENNWQLLDTIISELIK